MVGRKESRRYEVLCRQSNEHTLWVDLATNELWAVLGLRLD